MSNEGIQTRSEHTCHGGRLGFYTHDSEETRCPMNFAVYEPPAAAAKKLPALYYLAGLTCTEETFFIKAGALGLAAELGLALVACDTSPRGLGIPGEEESWDLGLGAGFYLDATEAPWAEHYRMASYINIELPRVVETHFSILPGRRGIFGHSMGGCGALALALTHPNNWHSVSAFAPICNPIESPWGQKAFSNYLGPDRDAWLAWDPSALMCRQSYSDLVLVDQGTADPFLKQQLRPEALEAAAEIGGQKLRLRRQEGYDHSYWFVQSFIGDHLHHHANRLLATNWPPISPPLLI